MTRAEIRKQFKTGWINPSLAAMLLGFDLDTKKLDTLIGAGVLSVWAGGKTPLVKLADVLASGELTADQFLAKYWPINRQRKPDRIQTANVLDTAAKRDEFRRKFDRLHRHVSGWIADPAEDLSHGELRLAFQLLQLCRRVSRFELIVTAKEIQGLTGLDREALPKARRGLERRKLLTTERSGTQAWVYSLCDPDTGLKMDDSPSPKLPVVPVEGWAESA